MKDLKQKKKAFNENLKTIKRDCFQTYSFGVFIAAYWLDHPSPIGGVQSRANRTKN
tara:strand:- start:30 stop:197 length:168 start_codon:yes stop_codon:yes gene_type:complete